MNIRPVGAELFHTDRRKDRHNATNCRFRNFAEATKKKREIYTMSVDKMP